MTNFFFKQLSKLAPNFEAQKSVHNVQRIFRQSKTLVTTTAAAAVISAVVLMSDKDKLMSAIGSTQDETLPTLSAFPVVNPTVQYGFALDTFHVIQDKIKSDDIFTTMLTRRGLTSQQAYNMCESVKDSYDFEKIQDGKSFMVLTKDPAKGYDYLIYEPDNRRYFIVDFKNASIKEVKREITTREFEASGKINENLWESMVGNGFSYALTDRVEDALKYKVDLRKFKEGDEYKLIWEEEFSEGRSIGIKQLKAIRRRKADLCGLFRQ
jgi:hypothetical protein